MRKIKESDIDNIVRMIDEARPEMKELTGDQWQDGKPNRDSILEYLRLGTGFIDESEKAFLAIKIDDVDYKELLKSPYAVIHSVVSDKSARGKGYVKKLFKEIEQYLIGEGIKIIGIDTHPKNIKMLSLIDKSGYKELGDVYIEGTKYRIAFYKEII